VKVVKPCLSCSKNFEYAYVSQEKFFWPPPPPSTTFLGKICTTWSKSSEMLVKTCGKEGNIAIFCFLRSNVYHATNMHFKSSIYSVCFEYKCHIINFLLTSLAWSLQRNIGPSPFLYRPIPWGEVCTKRPRFDTSL
jgi:hypothetical protein